jgi:hypothetical protein
LNLLGAISNHVLVHRLSASGAVEMSFLLRPTEFTSDVAEAVNAITLRLLGGRLPPALYHYTCFDAVLKIGNSRVLWATSAADLEDAKEIQYGAELVQEEVRRKVKSGVAEFPQMVLKLLPAGLIDCKPWTFVVCFCAMQDSGFHRNDYGEYCLEFDTRSSWDPQLRTRRSDADVRYYRAIYWRCVQRGAIRRAIDSIANSAAKNTSGVAQGPWMESMAQFCARNASQLLMDLVASFKARQFRREKEWRIVCRPNLSLNTSAPGLERDNFQHLVKGDHKHYVELQTPVPDRGQIIGGHPRSAVPFCSIRRPDGFRSDDDELRRIRRMLEENDRRDIKLC